MLQIQFYTAVSGQNILFMWIRIGCVSDNSISRSIYELYGNQFSSGSSFARLFRDFFALLWANHSSDADASLMSIYRFDHLADFQYHLCGFGRLFLRMGQFEMYCY